MKKRIVKRYSLTQQVADQLQKMIEDGVWKVGERIPTEPELTEMFAVSRNTLREAIRCLTSSGVLEVRQGDGTYVRVSNGFHARMGLAYEKVALDQVREARNVLEITMARLAARRRTAEDLQEIRRTLEARQLEDGEVRENTKADLAFHMAVARAAHNQVLENLYGSMEVYLESHISSRMAETALDSEQIATLHAELFRAILHQDDREAELCAQNILKI